MSWLSVISVDTVDMSAISHCEWLPCRFSFSDVADIASAIETGCSERGGGVVSVVTGVCIGTLTLLLLSSGSVVLSEALLVLVRLVLPVAARAESMKPEMSKRISSIISSNDLDGATVVDFGDERGVMPLNRGTLMEKVVQSERMASVW